MLLESLRHVTSNSEFSAVYFRRNAVQVKNPGGLWDESVKLFPHTGGKPTAHVMEWKWKGGGKVKFSHLEHEDSVLDWQGAAIPLIIFDELTHFTQNQFFYMMSRNRSLCGVRPYMRASTNPMADSWVSRLIEWWIDQDTGLPIPERSGVLRYFIRIHDMIVWGDSEEELISANPGIEVRPKSITFIQSKLEDNQALMKADPGYKANLMALCRVERERLLGGNWKIRPMSGMYFKRHEAIIVDVYPDDIIRTVRCWDLAATEEGEGAPDPDWTAGVLMGLRKNGRYVILGVIRERKRSGDIRKLVKNTAISDGYGVIISLAQDPGQAGKDQISSYVTDLAGYTVRTGRETGDKVTRAEPFSAQWQHGHVEVLRGYWNENYFSELESFPSKAHDDQVDASSGAFKALAQDNLIVWQTLGST